MKKQTKLAIFLFIFSFVVYAFFQFPGFQGYEDETYNRIVSNLNNGEFKTMRSGYAQTVLETPFVWKGQIMEKILNIRHDKISQLYALLYNPFVTALSAVVMFLIFSLFAGRKKAFLLSLIYAFGTMAFPYASIGMEPTAILFVLLSVYFLFRSGRNRVHPVPTRIQKKNIFLILSGLFYFLLFFSKAYYFITLPAFLAYIYLLTIENHGVSVTPAKAGTQNGLHGSRLKGRDDKIRTMVVIRNYILFTTPLLLIFPIYLLANKYNFGVYFGGQYKLSNELMGGERTLFGVYGLLLSFGKSLFVYSPALILSVMLFKRFYNQYKKEAVFISLYSSLLILFVGSIHWWSDETWGPRYLLSLSAIGLLPLVALSSVIPSGAERSGGIPLKLKKGSLDCARDDNGGYRVVSKIEVILISSILTLSFIFQLLGVLVRYDVFPYSFYDIYRATGYNVLASQEYQYIPQFAPYFVNFNYLKDRITGQNVPLHYKILYTPPMEQVSREKGNPTQEIVYDTSKYRNHAINFWWMNVPNVPPYSLLSVFILIFAGLGWWGRQLLKSKIQSSNPLK